MEGKESDPARELEVYNSEFWQGCQISRKAPSWNSELEPLPVALASPTPECAVRRFPIYMMALSLFAKNIDVVMILSLLLFFQNESLTFWICILCYL